MNFHFAITLDTRNLNARANYSQRSKYQQILGYGTRTYNSKVVAYLFFVDREENQWYIDSGCSKEMTGDKDKLISYNALEKEKSVTFGNDSHVVIKGKGYAFLK